MQVIDFLIAGLRTAFKIKETNINVLDVLPLTLLSLSFTYAYSLKLHSRNFALYNFNIFIGIIIFFLSTVSTNDLMNYLDSHPKLKGWITTSEAPPVRSFFNYLIHCKTQNNILTQHFLDRETPLLLERYISKKYISADFINIFVTLPFLSITFFGILYEFGHLFYADDPLYADNIKSKKTARKTEDYKSVFNYEKWFDEDNIDGFLEETNKNDSESEVEKISSPIKPYCYGENTNNNKDTLRSQTESSLKPKRKEGEKDDVSDENRAKEKQATNDEIEPCSEDTNSNILVMPYDIKQTMLTDSKEQ